MKEADLQRLITTNLRRDPRVTVVKIHGGPHQPLALDLIGCFEGKYFELEVKVPGKERNLSDRQALRIRKLRKVGAKTGVVTSVAQAKEIVYE